MNQAFRDVRDFIEKFAQPIDQPLHTDGGHLKAMRMLLIAEETEELADALFRNDRADVADALADLIYVAIGAAITFGIDLRPVWQAVQATNMAKEGGGVREDGKILKPEGWQPPDIDLALSLGDVRR